MEKRLTKKIEDYIKEFKDDIREYAITIGIENDDKCVKLLQFVYDYERLMLEKEDFMKRKRIKKPVNLFERCCAKRANGQQCTRRKRAECEYCGTHEKNTPYGTVTVEEAPAQLVQKIEVWVQEIQGINYYIDKTGNVYMPDDILTNQINPKVIAKYVKEGDKYSIPEFIM